MKFQAGLLCILLTAWLTHGRECSSNLSWCHVHASIDPAFGGHDATFRRHGAAFDRSADVGQRSIVIVARRSANLAHRSPPPVRANPELHDLLASACKPQADVCVHRKGTPLLRVTDASQLDLSSAPGPSKRVTGAASLLVSLLPGLASPAV